MEGRGTGTHGLPPIECGVGLRSWYSGRGGARVTVVDGEQDFDLIVRAHQVVEDGYEFFARRQLVTVFSAPNYCGEFDNAGAMMSVDETLMCSFQVLRPAEKKKGGIGGRVSTPAASKR